MKKSYAESYSKKGHIDEHLIALEYQAEFGNGYLFKDGSTHEPADMYQVSSAMIKPNKEVSVSTFVEDVEGRKEVGLRVNDQLENGERTLVFKEREIYQEIKIKDDKSVEHLSSGEVDDYFEEIGINKSIAKDIIVRKNKELNKEGLMSKLVGLFKQEEPEQIEKPKRRNRNRMR